ncbi:hypothetical protein PDE_02256 [Penicillium oxalicum 114-2]|uniref:Uncharacterized protein n=1 Tax=Penicillium oxalicum (strain 114-2 / CGMCC 5302) TaxID=933388 RepID=S8AN37_PENO1|nr:hypothetical protein PDE_02256 [Penicillium oxalicum 114-2]
MRRHGPREARRGLSDPCTEHWLLPYWAISIPQSLVREQIRGEVKLMAIGEDEKAGNIDRRLCFQYRENRTGFPQQRTLALGPSGPTVIDDDLEVRTVYWICVAYEKFFGWAIFTKVVKEGHGMDLAPTSGVFEQDTNLQLELVHTTTDHTGTQSSRALVSPLSHARQTPFDYVHEVMDATRCGGPSIRPPSPLDAIHQLAPVECPVADWLAPRTATLFDHDLWIKQVLIGCM